MSLDSGGDSMKMLSRPPYICRDVIALEGCCICALPRFKLFRSSDHSASSLAFASPCLVESLMYFVHDAASIEVSIASSGDLPSQSANASRDLACSNRVAPQDSSEGLADRTFVLPVLVYKPSESSEGDIERGKGKSVPCQLLCNACCAKLCTPMNGFDPTLPLLTSDPR